jgi:hypothetical protein
MSALTSRTPLIPESLVQFYRRMRKAFRSPPSADAVAIAALSRVVELHHCAAIVVQAAAERSDPSGQKQLETLGRDEIHLAHAVGQLVTELGGSPPRPEESSQKLPREPSDMSSACDQAELMDFVHEDLDFVRHAHRELAHSADIPSEMRQRLGG